MDVLGHWSLRVDLSCPSRAGLNRMWIRDGVDRNHVRSHHRVQISAQIRISWDRGGLLNRELSQASLTSFFPDTNIMRVVIFSKRKSVFLINGWLPVRQLIFLNVPVMARSVLSKLKIQ